MSQELDLDELRATYDHPADKSVIEVIDRLEQAELAVQRVRELSEHMRECVPDGLIRRDDTAWRIDRALDGEQE